MWPICLELAIADSSASQGVGSDDDDFSHAGTQNASPEFYANLPDVNWPIRSEYSWSGAFQIRPIFFRVTGELHAEGDSARSLCSVVREKDGDKVVFQWGSRCSS